MTDSNTFNHINTAIQAAIKAGEEIMTIYTAPNADFSIEKKADNSPVTIADKKSHAVINQMLKTTSIPILSEEGRDIPYQERKKWEKMWMVDPLDGTKEFIKRNDEFTVNIALLDNQRPVAGIIYVPVTKVLYVGVVNWGAFRLDGPPPATNMQLLAREGTALQSPKERAYYTIADSRSHMNEQTQNYVNQRKKEHQSVNIISCGSSLKICLVAEGTADEYPRFTPTMEWDTAAGHAIVNAAGKKLWFTDFSGELIYNKENLLNPNFIVK